MLKNYSKWLYLHHPAILEERRNKFAPPLPPQPLIPQTIIQPEIKDDPPKKIKAVKKKSKDVHVEVVEPPKEEVIQKKKTTTIKPKEKARIKIDENTKTDDDLIVDLSKKIKTINLKPAIVENENNSNV